MCFFFAFRIELCGDRTLEPFIACTLNLLSIYIVISVPS
jgi:hypothetical protein